MDFRWPRRVGQRHFSQIYNVDGSKRGSEIQVNTFAAGAQRFTAAASLQDGGWVVAWESDGQDGSGKGIFQQSYNSDGSQRGVETQVNTFTANGQYNVNVTSLIDGGWVVAWTSESQDGSDVGVFQQIYNADGSERVSETQINAYTNSAQDITDISSRGDGSWLVTWDSFDQDGSAWGVYQRIVQSYDVKRYEAGGGTQTIYAGSGNQTIYGDTHSRSASAPSGDDTIYGEDGNDKLFGGGGADKLNGGLGADTMTGGIGADQFIFDDGDNGITKRTFDRIADFSSAEGDKIDLSLVDGNRTTVADDSLTVAASQTVALSTLGQVWIEDRGKSFMVYINNDAAAGFDMMIEVKTTGILSAGDLVL